VEQLAPFALSTHIKDMGVAEAPDGFLLSEVAIGQGMLNMNRIVNVIQKARPKTRLSLEMITRNPLRVPCLTDKYWATFPERNGLHLARTLRMVQEKKSKLPLIADLNRDAQLKVEEDNVRKSLAWKPGL